MAQSTPAPVHCPSNVQTPGGSFYLPSESSIYATTHSCSRKLHDSLPLTKPNELLESKDVSPVRHTVRGSWNESSEGSRLRHLRKAKQLWRVVLDEVAPNQSEKLWHSLALSLNQQFSSDNESQVEDVGNVLINALTRCYGNASTWDTRRQILSIMADKATFWILNKWILDLTRYRFSISRKHTILHMMYKITHPRPL